MKIGKKSYDILNDNINFYYEQIDTKDYDYTDMDISKINPIFNFKYKWKGKMINLEDNPTILEFLSYINDYDKHKWLQKCLDTGIPVWTAIPFKELGFEFISII